MKKLFIVTTLVLTTFNSFSQTQVDSVKTDSTSIVQIDSVKSTTDSLRTELNKQTKIELTEVYLTELVRITTVMTKGFNLLTDNTPKSKYLNKKFHRSEWRMEKYQKSVIDEYREIIPYSNKNELINTIIYMKSIN